MTAYEVKSYPGAAADTLLNADLTSGGLSFSVTPGTGTNYPDGSQGPFVVALDYDNSKSEKIRVTSRINDTFTIATVVDRGYDSTTAQAHGNGAKVRAVWTATDAQEANRAAANTVGKVTAKGDLLAATAANTLGRVPVGADGTMLISDSAQAAGVRFGTPISLTVQRLDGQFDRTTYGSTGVAGGASKTWTVTTPGLATFHPGYAFLLVFTGRDTSGIADAAGLYLGFVYREGGTAATAWTLIANANPIGTGWTAPGAGNGWNPTTAAIAADGSSITFNINNREIAPLQYQGQFYVLSTM